MKEEDIELVNNFPSFSSSLTNNNNPNDDPTKFPSIVHRSYSLDQFSTDVENIQSSLDNIRAFMFDKLPEGATIDDLFGEEHVLLSPILPATSNLLTDPINVEENKSNTDFLYPSSSHCETSSSLSTNNIPQMDNQFFEQFLHENNRIQQSPKHLENRTSTRK